MRKTGRMTFEVGLALFIACAVIGGVSHAALTRDVGASALIAAVLVGLPLWLAGRLRDRTTKTPPALTRR